jgi:hypothetical protein
MSARGIEGRGRGRAATARWRPGLALVGWLVLLPAATSAQETCNCPSPSPEAWFADSALVFRGKVMRVERVAFRQVVDGKASIQRTEYVTFKPLQRFKGPKADLYVVSNAKCESPEADAQLCRAPCAQYFAIDAEFVVFALPDGEEPATTERCRAFNVKTDKAQAELSLKWLKAHK